MLLATLLLGKSDQNRKQVFPLPDVWLDSSYDHVERGAIILRQPSIPSDLADSGSGPYRLHQRYDLPRGAKRPGWRLNLHCLLLFTDIFAVNFLPHLHDQVLESVSEDQAHRGVERLNRGGVDYQAPVRFLVFLDSFSDRFFGADLSQDYFQQRIARANRFSANFNHDCADTSVGLLIQNTNEFARAAADHVSARDHDSNQFAAAVRNRRYFDVGCD